jgi:hypothetical protein
MLIDYNECVCSDAENCEVVFCAVCMEVEYEIFFFAL